MPRNWQKLDFEKDWLGLIDRRQTLDHPREGASLAKNMEFYGGSIAKRLGSQYLNGWGVVCGDDWTNVTNAQGTVDDASGLVVTENLVFYFPDGTSETKVISNISSNVVTVTGTFTYGAPPDGTPAVSRRPCGSSDRIDGLFQANFRDGTQKLLAAADDTIYTLPALGAGGSPAAVSRNMPVTNVDVSWGGDLVTGTLTSVEGLEAGDQIVLDGEEQTVTKVTPSSRTIIISPGMTPGNSPTGGEAVYFHPTRVAGDTHFVQHANITHIVTDTPTPGDSPPVKYLDVSGTYKIQRHGIRKPNHSGGTIAVAAGSGTGLTGVYKYVIKYYNSSTRQESDAGPVLTSPTLANQDCKINNLPVSVDPQVDKKRIYRSNSGGAGVFYFLDEIDNAETDYDGAGGNPGPDSTPDTGLGIQMRDFLDTPIPDAIGIITLWPQANRLVGINTSTGAIVFSDQIDLLTASIKPEAWPISNFFYINFDDGDKPRAVVAFYDSLVVFKERSSFRVQGIPPNITIEPLIFRQDLTGVGAFNQKGISVDQNEMLVPAEDGEYQFNRYEGDSAGFETGRISRQVDAWWDQVNYSYVKKAHGVFFRERRQYRLFLPRGDDDEPRDCITYQFEGAINGIPYGWAVWDVADALDGGIEVTASCVGKGTPDRHYIATATGDVIVMDYGYADRGAFPIAFEYATLWFSPAGKGVPARGRALDLALNVLQDSTINVFIDADFGERVGQITAALSAATGFVLGTSQLDVDNFGLELSERTIRMILRMLGEYHRLRFMELSNRGNFRLQNWTYWYQALPEATKKPSYVQDVTTL